MVSNTVNTWHIDDLPSDDDLTVLLAIHTPLQVFRAVYLINRALGLSLARRKDDLDVVQEGTLFYYPVYHFLAPESQCDFYVIANTSRSKSNQIDGETELFSKTHSYCAKLVPEKNKIDFFLKIKNDQENEGIVKTLRTITQFNSVYPLDIKRLKSRENLIFN